VLRLSAGCVDSLLQIESENSISTSTSIFEAVRIVLRPTNDISGTKYIVNMVFCVRLSGMYVATLLITVRKHSNSAFEDVRNRFYAERNIYIYVHIPVVSSHRPFRLQSRSVRHRNVLLVVALVTVLVIVKTRKTKRFIF
jgi:hypothetical protein